MNILILGGTGSIGQALTELMNVAVVGSAGVQNNYDNH